MTVTTTRSRITALALSGILATAACSSTPEEAPEPVTTPAVEAATETEPMPEQEESIADAPAVEETPELVEATAGDVISEDEAEQLPEGQRAFPLEDGTLVVVDDSEPLPEVIIEEAAAPPAAKTAEIGTTAGRTRAVYDEATAASSKIIGQTGRYPVMIYKMYDSEGWKYQATGAAAVNPAPTDKSVAVASAEAYIAAQDVPSQWLIIDATGE